MERKGGFRAFVATRWGRIALIALATLVLFASLAYLGVLIAIPAFLIFGLAVPILGGMKRPRYLATLGIVALLIATPAFTVFYAQELRTPSSPGSSDPSLPNGNGNSVLQNAQVSPFLGNSGGTYNFSVSVYPQYIPPGNGTPQWLNVWVSTCPGATGSSPPPSSNCGTPYPLVVGNYTFPPNTNGTTLVEIPLALNGNNVWWFQMGLAVRNINASTNKSTPNYWIFLNENNGYSGGIEGPVTGDFFTTLEGVILGLYVEVFLYVGGVFFFALVVYIWFKRREANRKEEAARAESNAQAPPANPGSGPTNLAAPPGTAAGSSIASTVDERRCPNCQAVVYPNETSCWKCGVSLPNSAESAPLRSANKGPQG
ncbi:MAG: zinc ribbon domain-containing protein [Thermoplasmata archaeon]